MGTGRASVVRAQAGVSMRRRTRELTQNARALCVCRRHRASCHLWAWLNQLAPVVVCIVHDGERSPPVHSECRHVRLPPSSPCSHAHGEPMQRRVLDPAHSQMRHMCWERTNWTFLLTRHPTPEPYLSSQGLRAEDRVVHPVVHHAVAAHGHSGRAAHALAYNQRHGRLAVRLCVAGAHLRGADAGRRSGAGADFLLTRGTWEGCVHFTA